MIMAHLLSALREALAQAGLTTKVAVPNGAGILLDFYADHLEYNCIVIPDVSYVDDLAFVLTPTAADQLIPRIATGMSIVDKVIAAFEFTMNLKPWKSAAIVHLVGPSSREQHIHLQHHMRNLIPFDTEGGLKHVGVVHTYKHV